jgi:hypothetical protein
MYAYSRYMLLSNESTNERLLLRLCRSRGRLTPWMGNFRYAIRFRTSSSISHHSPLCQVVHMKESLFVLQSSTLYAISVSSRSSIHPSPTRSLECPLSNPSSPSRRLGRSCTSSLLTTSQTSNSSPLSPSFPAHLRSRRTHIQCPQDPRLDILPRQVHRGFARADRGRVCCGHRGRTAAARSLRARAGGPRTREHKE